MNFDSHQRNRNWKIKKTIIYRQLCYNYNFIV